MGQKVVKNVDFCTFSRSKKSLLTDFAEILDVGPLGHAVLATPLHGILIKNRVFGPGSIVLGEGFEPVCQKWHFSDP